MNFKYTYIGSVFSIERYPIKQYMLTTITNVHNKAHIYSILQHISLKRTVYDNIIDTS